LTVWRKEDSSASAGIRTLDHTACSLREDHKLRELQNTAFEEDTWAKRDELISSGLSQRRS
jgi:hypothetical protein